MRSYLTDSNIGYAAVKIIDFWNHARGKRLPPYPIIRAVGGGSTAEFVAVGRKFRQLLQTLAELQPSDSCLDIGCGCGRIALQLTDFLDTGTYDGIDVMRNLIRWCNERIAQDHPNFQFTFADIYNKRYNPKGQYSSEEYKFPYENDRFDIVILTSVFTHMRIPGFRNYLREIVRVLRPGGRVFLTLFLVNAAVLETIESGNAQVRLAHRYDDHCWVEDTRTPEKAVGFDEDYALEQIESVGLKIDCIQRGSWSRQGATDFQDIIVASS